MGIFSGLFGGDGASDAYEHRLVEERAAGYMSMGLFSTFAEARKTATDQVQAAKRIVAERGDENEPPNLGDMMLRAEGSNPKLHERMEMLRSEGVRNEDIRWWWNMPPIERVLCERDDEMARYAVFAAAMDSGKTADEAGTIMRRTHPIWGDSACGQGDDRPLPIELKNRVLEFSERQRRNPDEYLRLMDAATSFNALIREVIHQELL